MLSSPEQQAGRICAIVNPRAGGWKRRPQSERQNPEAMTARWLSPDDPASVGVKVIQGAGEGTRLTREAIAEGYETLVAVGGDGTINDVIQGICADPLEQRVTLGLLPMGTANVLSRILHLPRYAPEQAAAIIRQGHTQPIDLGRMGERWFALVAGIGFDGAVTEAVNMAWKRRVGRLAYLAATARVAAHWPRRTIALTLDSNAPQTFDAYLVLVANGGLYAGNFQLSSDTRLDDGLLDVFVCLRRAPLPRAVALDALALVRKRFAQSPGVRHFRVRSVTLDADTPLPVQLDGDAAGTTPVSIVVAPQALNVLVRGKPPA